MSDDIDMINIVNTIKKMSDTSNRPDTMVFGTVVKTSPLEIDIGNEIVLTEKFLFLGQMCRPHKVKIPHTHIVDTHFTELSPSVGSIGSGMVAGVAFETAQKAASAAAMNSYTTLDDKGNEIQHTISDKDLGRSSIATSIKVGGAASIMDDSVMITDSKHKHIIPRQTTKDVHLPKSDYEECVVLDIEPKLAVGDKVLMFAFNNYQMYYVAERIES